MGEILFLKYLSIMEAIRHRRRCKKYDTLEYLKFALINCRKIRMNKEQLERLSLPRIKATGQNGFTFYYTVTDTVEHPDDDNFGDDENDLEEGSDEEDEVLDYVTKINQSSVQDQEYSSNNYLQVLDPPEEYLPNVVNGESDSFPVNFDDFLSNIKRPDTLTSFDDFYSAIDPPDEDNIDRLCQHFDTLNVIEPESISSEFQPNDALISGNFCQQNVQNNTEESTDSAIDEVLGLLDQYDEIFETKSILEESENAPNDTLTYLNIDSNVTFQSQNAIPDYISEKAVNTLDKVPKNNIESAQFEIAKIAESLQYSAENTVQQFESVKDFSALNSLILVSNIDIPQKDETNEDKSPEIKMHEKSNEIQQNLPQYEKPKSRHWFSPDDFINEFDSLTVKQT